jgi:hypothetical protein
MNSALLQRPRPQSHPPTPWLQRPSGAVRATLFINELQMCYDPFIQQWVRYAYAHRIIVTAESNLVRAGNGQSAEFLNPSSGLGVISEVTDIGTCLVSQFMGHDPQMIS